MPTLKEVERLYHLNEKQKDLISKIIIENFTAGVTPAKNPIAIILAVSGKPGNLVFQVSNGIVGRLVDKDIHDQKYAQVVSTLEVVQKSGIYDRLYIYGRAGRQKVKGMHNGLIKISENGPSPVNDYISEVEKEWSDNDLRFFNDDVFVPNPVNG